MKISKLNFTIDPSLYPYLTIYPAPYGEVDDIEDGQNGDSTKELSPVLTIGYPYFTLCKCELYGLFS